jgi:hypothetical protein
VSSSTDGLLIWHPPEEVACGEHAHVLVLHFSVLEAKLEDDALPVQVGPVRLGDDHSTASDSDRLHGIGQTLVNLLHVLHGIPPI